MTIVRGMLIVRWICRQLLPLLALLASSPAMAQDAASDPAAEFQKLERALADAMHAKDEVRLDGLLAPDYVLRGDDSRYKRVRAVDGTPVIRPS